MIPKTVKIESPNGSKTKTPKKQPPKSIKSRKMTKQVPKWGPQGGSTNSLFRSFRASGHPWRPTGLPEVPPKPQGSLQEAIWSHFSFKLHTCSTHFGSFFLNSLASIFICFSTAPNKQTNEQTHTHTNTHKKTTKKHRKNTPK